MALVCSLLEESTDSVITNIFFRRRLVMYMLNVDTGQNPRRHVILIEIQPNAYNKYLSPTAGIILRFVGVVYSISVYLGFVFLQTLLCINVVLINLVTYKLNYL